MRKLLWFLLVGMASAQTCITGTFATTPNLALKLPFYNQCNWGIQGYNPNFTSLDTIIPLKAPLLSPAFTGIPTAPTATLGTNTTQLATTAFVIANAGSGAVSSVFGRIGVVVKVAGDYAVADITGAAPLASPTFTGTVTLPASQALTTPVLGTPTSVTLTNGTGLPESGVTSLVSDLALKAPLASPTFTGTVTLPASQALTTPVLGTPTSVTLTNATGLPISTGVSGLGTGIATLLGTPSSANLAAALTNETGTSLAVFNTSPTLVTPTLGVASATSLTTSGSNGGIDGTEGTGAGLTAATSHDLLYADSTAHRWKMNNNNGTTKTVAAVEESTVGQYCGTTTTCSATAVVSPQEVYGHATLAGGTATVTAISPVFGATATTECFANDRTDATKTANAVLASTSSITLTGTGTDVIGYHCIGAK